MIIQNRQGQLIQQSQILYYQQPQKRQYVSGVLEHKVIIQNDSVNNSWMNNKIQELDDKVNEMNLKRSRCEQELNNEQLMERNRQLMKAIVETKDQINNIRQEQMMQKEYQQRVNVLLEEKQELQRQLKSRCDCQCKIEQLQQQLRDTENIIEDITKKYEEQQKQLGNHQKIISQLKQIIDQQNDQLIWKENENQQLRIQQLQSKHNKF